VLFDLWGTGLSTSLEYSGRRYDVSALHTWDIYYAVDDDEIEEPAKKLLLNSNKIKLIRLAHNSAAGNFNNRAKSLSNIYNVMICVCQN
jgi:hypothetical protein